MAKSKAKFVIVRTYSAGVEFGELVSQKGKEVVLRNSRKLWYWCGAFTLHAVAKDGIKAGSKISVPVDEVKLTEAIEVLSCSPAAIKCLAEFPAHVQ